MMIQRLKTHLRSTITLSRLSNIVVLHAYHDYVQDLSVETLSDEFNNGSAIRQNKLAVGVSV